MKRSQLNALRGAILEFINDKIEINGTLCGLPIKYEVRKKSHQILKKITEAVESSDKASKEIHTGILEKYGISESAIEIKKEEQPDAYEELIKLQKQVNDEDILINFSGFEYTDEDFKTSNGRNLDIGANISPILEYLYK